MTRGRVRRGLVFLATLTLCACATLPEGSVGPRGASLPPTTKPRAERPSYTLGERWIRSDGAYDLVRIEKDLYVFASASGREIHLTKDLAVARVQKGQSFMTFDPPPEFKWPLEVGKWGTSRLNWQHSWGPVTPNATFTWKVEAYEELNTIAGKFMAFRIVQRMESDPGSRPDKMWKRELVTWYAPEARQLVKVEGDPWFAFLAFQVLSVDRPTAEPLAITLQAPKDQMKVTSQDIVLTGKVTSGKGVAALTITLNGEEVRKWDAPSAPSKETPLDLPVKLREGKNVLLVTAVDPEGASRQEARTLFYEKPVPPDRVPIPIAPPAATPVPAPAPPPPVAAKPVPPQAPAKPPEPAKAAPTPAPMAPPPVIAKPAPSTEAKPVSAPMVEV